MSSGGPTFTSVLSNDRSVSVRVGNLVCEELI
jgi:hypothetical protein